MTNNYLRTGQDSAIHLDGKSPTRSYSEEVGYWDFCQKIANPSPKHLPYLRKWADEKHCAQESGRVTNCSADGHATCSFTSDYGPERQQNPDARKDLTSRT